MTLSMQIKKIMASLVEITLKMVVHMKGPQKLTKVDNQVKM